MTDPKEPIFVDFDLEDDPKPSIYEADEKDWEDFFAVQEDETFLFDR